MPQQDATETVIATETVRDQPVTLDVPVLGVARVRFLDGNGRPIEGVRLSAGDEGGGGTWTSWLGGSTWPGGSAWPSAGSDERGVATLAGWALGQHVRLLAQHPRFAPRAVEADARGVDSAPVDVVLDAQAIVTGLVRDEAGAPLSGARVTARADAATAGGTAPASEEWSSTRADGPGTVAAICSAMSRECTSLWRALT